MNYAAQAMIDGFYIAKEFNIQEFNIDQIYEIVAGYHSQIDYNIYANPVIPAEHMSVIRHGLEVGYNVGYDLETRDITFVAPKSNGPIIEPYEE